MDKINGITAIYSLLICLLLLFVNYDVHFIKIMLAIKYLKL